MARGKVDMHFQHRHFVARILIEADLADSQYVGAVQEFWNQSDNVASQSNIFGFFWINAKPTIMRQAELGGSPWFVICELAKIIIKPRRRTAIKSCPKGRFADRGTPGSDHIAIIVGHTADHVGMRFDIAHELFYLLVLPDQAPHAPLVVALGIGSLVGSLRARRTCSARRALVERSCSRA